MFSKSNIISTLVTAVWGYFGGWLIWGTLLKDFLSEHAGGATGVMREMPDRVHLIIGCLIVAFVFSTIYKKWGSDGYSISSGLTYGIWVGLLLGLGEGMIIYAVKDVSDLTGTLVNAGAGVVFYAVMGLLAGLVYNKTS
ncbi:MAG: hypothetical protein E2O83_04305 [Bacteroidetes bacterium]|nr:MAG: hypothetical protein E2O86_02500 [Bacteroidota bacterium]TDI79732.1 MAG: hypothetical protein E2O83_04305 [Bacteroidota bacterium]